MKEYFTTLLKYKYISVDLRHAHLSFTVPVLNGCLGGFCIARLTELQTESNVWTQKSSGASDDLIHWKNWRLSLCPSCSLKPFCTARTHRNKPRSSSYRCAAAAGVQEEVGRVSSNRGLGGDRPVTQSHADDGSHVGFCAKNVNWDPGGFSCRGGFSESACDDHNGSDKI